MSKRLFVSPEIDPGRPRAIKAVPVNAARGKGNPELQIPIKVKHDKTFTLDSSANPRHHNRCDEPMWDLLVANI